MDDTEAFDALAAGIGGIEAPPFFNLIFDVDAGQWEITSNMTDRAEVAAALGFAMFNLATGGFAAWPIDTPKD